MKKEIYLDNAATTKPYEQVLQTMAETALNNYYNPSSAYKNGLDCEKILLKSRLAVSQTIGAARDEIVFTSGGTESNNQAVTALCRANKNKGSHVISSKTEHSSVYDVVKALKPEFETDYVKLDKYANIDIENLKTLIKKDTILVSLMHVNNETGTLYPISTIGEIIKSINPNCYFHVDCVQSFMKEDIDVNEGFKNVDLLSVSAHKIHGPKGIGFLYVRKNTKLPPLIDGGGQESGLRSGTENLPAIAGFAKACEILAPNLKKELEDVLDKKNFFLSKIKENITDITVNTPENSAPHILNVSFLGVRGQVLLNALESCGVLVSTASACSAKTGVSRVLKELKRPGLVTDGAIRFSLDASNAYDELDYAVKCLKENVEAIRKISNYKTVKKNA